MEAERASGEDKQRALAVTNGGQQQELAVQPGYREVPALAEPVHFVNNFDGLSSLELTDAEIAVLHAPVPEDQVEVKPDGIVYLPQIFYRDILLRTFRPGKWALAPRQPPKRDGENVLYFGALYVRGVFVSEAIGECQCRFGMSYASALEGARSDCLTRVCKDLGVAKELWNPSWREAWLEKWALKSWVPAKDGRSKDKFFYWRKDREIPADVRERGERPQPARSGERWDPNKAPDAPPPANGTPATSSTHPPSPTSSPAGAAAPASPKEGGGPTGTGTADPKGATPPAAARAGSSPAAAGTPGTAAASGTGATPGTAGSDLAELKKLLAATFTPQHRKNFLKKYWPHTGGEVEKLKLHEQTDCFALLDAWAEDKANPDPEVAKARPLYTAKLKQLMDDGRVPNGEAKK